MLQNMIAKLQEEFIVERKYETIIITRRIYKLVNTTEIQHKFEKLSKESRRRMTQASSPSQSRLRPA